MNLAPLFNPKSIAIIGASQRFQSVGHAIFKNLLANRFQGIIYPVNPKVESIDGVKTYPSILAIPDRVDLAILIVPAEATLSVFKDCLKKGVAGAIVISAGFKEVGEAGAKLERELAALAVKNKIPLLGPNCLGLINTDPGVSMNASFARSMPQKGNISFISQSGALCTAVLDYARAANIRFSKFISMGNKAVINEIDLLEFLEKDKETDVILMYLEELVNPRKMIDLCRRITGDDGHVKPILAIKSGRTLEGAKAASSHTGSLAGSDEVFDFVFAQGGILRVESVQELFDYAKAFSSGELPKKNRIAIVTNAGGPGIMATDAAVRYGLQIPTLSAKTVAALKKELPATANTQNPVDVIGDAQHNRYQAALKIVLKEKEIDGVIVILTPQAMTDIEEIAQVVGQIGSKSKKPVLACFMGIYDVSQGVKILEKWGIPHYSFPESAAKAFSGLTRYVAWTKRPRTQVRSFKVDRHKAKQILKKVLSTKRKNLTDEETFSLLQAYGFPLLPTRRCATPQEAARAAEEIGFPVALKISSPDILHKVDVGGVRLNLRSSAKVEIAAQKMLKKVKKAAPHAKDLKVTVQKMADKGREVILGLKRDPLFGPLLMFGLGGTYVEVMKDVTFRIAPIRQLGAHNMIHSIRAYPILEGVRGEKPADLPKLEEALERLSQLAMDCEEISELDINPLVAFEKGKGCVVIDARIVLK